MASSKNMLDMENRHRCTEMCNKMTVSQCCAARLYDRGHRSAECECVDYGGFERPNVDELYDHEPVLHFQFHSITCPNKLRLVCDGQFME